MDWNPTRKLLILIRLARLPLIYETSLGIQVECSPEVGNSYVKLLETVDACYTVVKNILVVIFSVIFAYGDHQGNPTHVPYIRSYGSLKSLQ